MKVDVDALFVAFSDESVERSYYLDSDSGQVFNVLEDHDDPETQELVWQLEADTRGRYIQVPKPSIEERFQEQDSFLESLPDGDLKAKLETLLASDNDGTKFEEFVDRNREAREAWRDYRMSRSREQAAEWLRKIGIEAD